MANGAKSAELSEPKLGLREAAFESPSLPQGILKPSTKTRAQFHLSQLVVAIPVGSQLRFVPSPGKGLVVDSVQLSDPLIDAICKKLLVRVKA